MSGVYDVGDVIPVWAVFRNPLGAQTAPTDVTLTVLSPDGVSTDVVESVGQVADETLAESAVDETLSGVTGVYKADVALDQSGIWIYKWTGTGAVATVESGVLYVRPDPIPVGEGS